MLPRPRQALLQLRSAPGHPCAPDAVPQTRCECARAATVTCVTPGVLWGLDRISYRKIMQQAHNSSTNTVTAMLRSLEPLKPLDAHQIRAAHGRPQHRW